MEPLDPRVLLAVNFTFTILDPTNQFKSIRPQLQRLFDTAGKEWATHFENLNANLEYVVGFTSGKINDFELMTGAPKSAPVVGTDPTTGANLLQTGPANEIVTGVDPNGKRPDAGITIYAPNIPLMFFDPDLNRRNAVIPAGEIDTYSVILHEIGHTLGFYSNLNVNTGLPNPQGEYLYDQNVSGSGGSFEYDGTTTEAVYMQPIPLEFDNPAHVGSSFGNFIFPPGFIPDPTFFQDDFASVLMAGVIDPGERKTISRIDLAMLADAQTPVTINTDNPPTGPLVVQGTGMADSIDVGFTNQQLIVRVNNSILYNLSVDETADITSITVDGLAGSDYITISGDTFPITMLGGSGNDTLIGGIAVDNLNGGEGNDSIMGGNGADRLDGGGGQDTLRGQGGSDVLLGRGGNDFLDGGAGNDRCYGGNGNDIVKGGDGDDRLFGEAGADLLVGGNGKDRMDGGTGGDAFYGQDGNDSVDYSTRTVAIVASIDGSPNDGEPGEGDNIVDCDNIIGTPFNDRMLGNDGPNSLIGGGGNDTMDGSGGNDTLEAGNGNDFLIGSGGNDSIIAAGGNDRLVGGTGHDSLNGGDGNDTIDSADGAFDNVDGGNGTDTATVDSIDQVINVESATTAAAPIPAPAALPLHAIATKRIVQEIVT